jgi:hypothetical protein
MPRWPRAAPPCRWSPAPPQMPSQACLAGLDVEFAAQSRPRRAAWLRRCVTGLAALPADADAAVVLLADMPFIDGDHIDRLIAAFDPRAAAHRGAGEGRPARQSHPLAARTVRRNAGGGGRCRRARPVAAGMPTGRDASNGTTTRSLPMSIRRRPCAPWTMSADEAPSFPCWPASPDLHYLDSAATSQIHRNALDAVVRHETGSRANVMRGTHALAEAADRAYESARASAARFLNAAADEIVFALRAPPPRSTSLRIPSVAACRQAIAWWCRRPSTTATSCPGRCCASAGASCSTSCR